MNWKTDIEEIRKRRTLAKQQGGGPQQVQRKEKVRGDKAHKCIVSNGEMLL